MICLVWIQIQRQIALHLTEIQRDSPNLTDSEVVEPHRVSAPNWDVLVAIVPVGAVHE